MFLHSLMLFFSALTVFSVVLLAVWMLFARQGRQAISSKRPMRWRPIPAGSLSVRR